MQVSSTYVHVHSYVYKYIWLLLKQLVSRNIAFKVARLGDLIFERQSEVIMTEAVTVNSPSHEEDLDDVGCNADLYAFKQGAFQVCIAQRCSGVVALEI